MEKALAKEHSWRAVVLGVIIKALKEQICDFSIGVYLT
ncbi:hypothetical protein Syn7502_00124 [Synechococcus sp. PCC 7502]|nr:hypothetical protein Syn7502_00124 [Synechococcus sp. PCC 7502]